GPNLIKKIKTKLNFSVKKSPKTGYYNKNHKTPKTKKKTPPTRFLGHRQKISAVHQQSGAGRSST
ncbi:hypothetical protein, partial [Salmonella enterica]|uniref:hypothetical protein n=1 Tax=Salmonella enterica TaxID=28901 RepID=UPI0020C240CD